MSAAGGVSPDPNAAEVIAETLTRQLVDHGAYEYAKSTLFSGDAGRVYLGQSRRDVYTAKVAAVILDALAAAGFALVSRRTLDQLRVCYGDEFTDGLAAGGGLPVGEEAESHE